MRIIAFPMFIFEILAHRPALLMYAMARFREVAQDAIIIHMPVYDYDRYPPRIRGLFKWFEADLKAVAKQVFHIKGLGDSVMLPYEIDEMIMRLPPGSRITICGGYMEDGLGRLFGVFARDYDTYCRSNDIEIVLDEERALCARHVREIDDIFFSTRRNEDKPGIKEDFAWWERVSGYPIRPEQLRKYH